LTELSTLIRHLNHLGDFNPEAALVSVSRDLDPVIYAVNTHAVQVADIAAGINDSRAQVDLAITQVLSGISQLKQELQAMVEKIEPKYLADSYNLYETGLRQDRDQQLISRRLRFPEETERYLVARMCRHTDWHYPGAIIRPGHETWIQNLVALDPLYILDIDIEMLYPGLSHFPPEYQDRLRRCVIAEHKENAMLEMLPKNQLGYMLVYNYFNFRPLEIIRGMLSEIYQCLRPGGTVAFTFNNCDKAGAVELVEKCYSCYTPGRLVLASAELLGYSVEHVYEINEAVTWVELSKPGTLTNIRGGQALAKIVAKSRKTQ